MNRLVHIIGRSLGSGWLVSRRLRRINISGLVALVFILATWDMCAAAGQYEDGLTSYDRGDFNAAIRLLTPLASRGNALAQFTLGNMNAQGQGTPQDYAEAAKWYGKAAARGEASAQFNLGHLYRLGKGVAQDYAQAFSWYNKAARQGLVKAQSNLAAMYAGQLGVSQNKVAAFMWVTVALAHLGPGDPTYFSSIKLRDALLEQMTSRQVAQGEGLAKRWTPILQSADAGPGKSPIKQAEEARAKSRKEDVARIDLLRQQDAEEKKAFDVYIASLSSSGKEVFSGADYVVLINPFSENSTRNLAGVLVGVRPTAACILSTQNISMVGAGIQKTYPTLRFSQMEPCPELMAKRPPDVLVVDAANLSPRLLGPMRLVGEWIQDGVLEVYERLGQVVVWKAGVDMVEKDAAPGHMPAEAETRR